MTSSSQIPGFPNSFLKDALKIIKSSKSQEKVVQRALELQSWLIRYIGEHMTKNLGIHPSYLFAKLLPFNDTCFIPKQLAHFFFRYLASLYTIPIEF